MSDAADVVVIGMGVGGEEAAAKLIEAGLDVVGVEKELVGGECPYWACVPTKMMVRAAGLLAEARRIPGMAGDATVIPDWMPVANRIRAEATDNWDDTVAVERFEKQGGRFVRGTGRLDGPGRVVVDDDQVIEARQAVVLATGTIPSIPPVPGLEAVDYWTNRQAVATESVPASLVVMGGGVVGCEFAQLFARFGSRVTIVEGLHHLIADEEVEACQLLQKVFAREGIDVRTGAKATGVARDGNQIAVTLDDGERVTGDRLLVATGRQADLKSLGLRTVGLDGERWVPVDDRLRVKGVERLWAIGDVTGGGFTHMATYHARIAAADILGGDGPGADDRAVPRVMFTDPEVGAVGLTERAAREKGIDVRTGLAQIPSSARGWIHKVGNDGFIKLVEDATRGVLVGATSVGPVGGEVLSMLTLAVHAEVPTDDLRTMVYAYPTFHRAVEDALRDLTSR